MNEKSGFIDLIKPEERLSEEHERQIARFERVPYKRGYHMREIAFVRWKRLNHRLMIAAAALRSSDDKCSQ